MIVPKKIAIDTSFFESKHYNFDSRQFKMFIKYFNSGDFELLMPDPFMREIERHLSEKARGAVAALKALQKKTPFVRVVEGWPLNDDVPAEIQRVIRETYGNRLRTFLEQCKFRHLDYTGVSIDTVMRWYDEAFSPFGDGAKRKEFPDAFAIAILDNYCRKKRESVAIISLDNDIARACEDRPHLCCFRSLSAYVEAASAFEEERIAAIKMMLSCEPYLEESLRQQFLELEFVVQDIWDAEVFGVEVDAIDASDIDITSIDSESFCISFRAHVTYAANLGYDDPDSGFYDKEDDVWFGRERVSTAVIETTTISGSASFGVDEDWAVIEELYDMEIDGDAVSIYVNEIEY